MSERTQLQRIVDLLNEAGMLKETPRTGYQFLGTGRMSVAEHSHRTAIIGYVLARMAGADVARTVLICLFHDLGEARVGDMNYVNQRYVQTREEQAVADALQGTGMEDILDLWREHEYGREPTASLEGQLARDADQLDLLLDLKRLADLGNSYAMEWFDSAEQRLLSMEAKQISSVIRTTDHSEWWRLGVPASWWVNRTN